MRSASYDRMLQGTRAKHLPSTCLGRSLSFSSRQYGALVEGSMELQFKAVWSFSLRQYGALVQGSYMASALRALQHRIPQHTCAEVC
jgi:hypothetical protein